MTLYNDNDPFVCAWLRELIAAGHLPAGEVLSTPIEQLHDERLSASAAFHAFAGIGGWPLALRLAGWPDEWPVWTGSCPCQPFSCAGQRRGTADKRHLWPAFRDLIAQHAPPVVFGEQVAGGGGKRWMAEARRDLENLGYAVGLARLPVCFVGAQHFRYRFYYVAHSLRAGLEGLYTAGRQVYLQPARPSLPRHDGQATPRVLSRINGFSSKLDRPPSYREQIQAYGNAIVPQAAATFIRASLETLGELTL